MENNETFSPIVAISAHSLLGILEWRKFKFTLEKIDSIISRELKEELLRKITENLESNEKVEISTDIIKF